MGGSSFAEKMMMPVLNSLTDKFKLVAIASRNPAKANDLANQFSCESVVGYQALIERADIDAVYCPLPTGLHFEWGMKALDQGKHIILEKSLTANLHEAEELLNKGKELNLCVMENFMFQYHNQQAFVKEQIEANAIGEIRNFRSTFGFPPFPDADNIRYQKELGGGALLDAGAYTVKAAQMILGNDLNVKGASLFYDKNIGVDIFGSAFLESGTGISAQLAFGFDNYYQCSYEIWGSKGKISVTRAFTAKPNFEPEVVVENQAGRTVFKQPADNQYQKFFEIFYEKISKNSFSEFFESNLLQAKLIHQIFDHAK